MDTGITGDNIVLFSSNVLTTGQKFQDSIIDSNQGIGTYQTSWGCTYDDGSTPTDVFFNEYYGASSLRTALKSLAGNSAYFTSKDQEIMNDSSVATYDYRNSKIYTTTDKLYEPYVTSESATNIIAGSEINNNKYGSLIISKDYWNDASENEGFWLRAADNYYLLNDHAYTCYKNQSIFSAGVNGNNSCKTKPVLDISISQIAFASIANAAKISNISGGVLSTDSDNVMTFRYSSSLIGKGVMDDDLCVNLSGVSGNDTYLVVQNNSGVYALAVDSNTKTISANEITGAGLSSFYNCKVWLEQYNSVDARAYVYEIAVPSKNGTSYGSACNHHYEWVINREPTETQEGEMVYKCSICGNIIARQPISSYEYYIYKCVGKINTAKAGDTVVLSSGCWNSYPKSFFEKLAVRRDITLEVKFTYNHKNYEMTITPEQTIDTSIDYYGPLKLMELYGASEVTK